MSAEHDPADEARGFALEHAHYVEDIPFWRAAAARLGGPVLDLGAATGRVAIPLAEDGHGVCALDASPHMLAELERRAAAAPTAPAGRLRAVRGDLTRLNLGHRFRLVIMAMNTLQALVEPESQLACLAGVRRHLAPGGELAFDVALPDLGEIAASMGEERPGGGYLDPRSGAIVAHSAWYDAFDPVTQTLEFTLRVRVSGDGPPRERLRRHRVHVFMPSELTHLLARAGLRPVQVLGDFAGGPVRADSERQIYRCVAAEGAG